MRVHSAACSKNPLCFLPCMCLERCLLGASSTERLRVKWREKSLPLLSETSPLHFTQLYGLSFLSLPSRMPTRIPYWDQLLFQRNEWELASFLPIPSFSHLSTFYQHTREKELGPNSSSRESRNDSYAFTQLGIKGIPHSLSSFRQRKSPEFQ